MTISLLVDKGALVHTSNMLHTHGGKSIIHHAVLNGNVAILTKLLRTCGFSVIYSFFSFSIANSLYNQNKLFIFVIALFKDCKCCLLYTSPSPRDRTRSRMPSSA